VPIGRGIATALDERGDSSQCAISIRSPRGEAAIGAFRLGVLGAPLNKITTNTVEIASIRIYARALQSSVEVARLGEHVIARADRRAAHQVGGDRASDALSQVEAVGDDGL
jgi:hypothetical protein